MTQHAPASAAHVLDLTPGETAAGVLSDESRQRALLAMNRFGFLQMNAVLSRELTTALAAAYADEYSAEDPRELRDACYPVGHKRDMVTVRLAPPFNTPELYANPHVLPVLNDLLGNEAVLLSFGAVCAFPGASAQHVHLDHPPLFRETNLAGLLPCHAVTVVVPLVDLDRAAGATAVWLGSHRDAASVPLSARPPDTAVIPETRLGSIYMMDYRLVHGGAANTSNHPRPILYAVYARPWFTDAVNFRSQPGLRISSDDLAAVPDAFKGLFLHCREPR